VVGGAVRDALLGASSSDIDLATRFLPQETQARLERAGLKAVPTGIAHGTITAVAHGEVFEVTTLRRDVSTNGRHAVVAFDRRLRAGLTASELATLSGLLERLQHNVESAATIKPTV